MTRIRYYIDMVAFYSEFQFFYVSTLQLHIMCTLARDAQVQQLQRELQKSQGALQPVQGAVKCK